MLISGLALLMAAGAANANYCERLTRRFDSNERFMGASFDLNVQLYRAEKKFADATGTYEAQSKALDKKRIITSDLQKGFDSAHEIEAQMLAAKCNMPDHDATWLTYGTEKMPN